MLDRKDFPVIFLSALLNGTEKTAAISRSDSRRRSKRWRTNLTKYLNQETGDFYLTVLTPYGTPEKPANGAYINRAWGQYKQRRKKLQFGNFLLRSLNLR